MIAANTSELEFEMDFLEEFIASEKAKVAKEIEKSVEECRRIMTESYYDDDSRELLRVLLSTPMGILHNAMGFGLYSNIPEKSKDSDVFPPELFCSHINSFELKAKLEFIPFFLSYCIHDDGSPGVCHYKEVRIRSGRFETKVFYAEPDEKDAIPFFTDNGAELWQNISKKKYLYKERDYINCIEYWRNREIKNVELIRDFDDLEEGQSFTQALSKRFDTPDAVFGRKLFDQLSKERKLRLNE